jgi:hypothetical protein
VIVVGNEATTSTNRERRRLWSARPSACLAVSSIAETLIASALAISGFARAPLPPTTLVAGTLGVAIEFAFAMQRSMDSPAPLEVGDSPVSPCRKCPGMLQSRIKKYRNFVKRVSEGPKTTY